MVQHHVPCSLVYCRIRRNLDKRNGKSMRAYPFLSCLNRGPSTMVGDPYLSLEINLLCPEIPTRGAHNNCRTHGNDLKEATAVYGNPDASQRSFYLPCPRIPFEQVHEMDRAAVCCAEGLWNRQGLSREHPGNAQSQGSWSVNGPWR